MSWLKKLKTQTWLSIVGALLAVIFCLSIALGVVAGNMRKLLSEEKTEEPIDEPNDKPNDVENQGGSDEGNENLGSSVNHNDHIFINTIVAHGLLFSAEAVIDVDEKGEKTLGERITATITPANADNALLDWEIVGWKMESPNGWAEGKDPNDYIGINPIYDGALVADVFALDAFAEYAIVRASVRGDESVYAECEIGYRQRFNGFSATIVYENELNPELNLNWVLGSAEIANVDFPFRVSSIDDFNKYYGLLKNVKFTVTTSLSDVYTDSAIVKNVKAEVSCSGAYRNAILENGGEVDTEANAYVTLGTGEFSEAVLEGVRFSDILMLPKENLDLLGFKQTVKESKSSAFLKIKITALVNGEEQMKEYVVFFNQKSLESNATDVVLDRDKVIH